MKYIFVGICLLICAAAQAVDCEGSITPYLTRSDLGFVGPQAIAYDEDLDSFWITSGLSTVVRRFDSRLREIEAFDAEFPPLPVPFPFEGITGIAVTPDDTLLVSRPAAEEIWEFEKDGTPTGLIIRPLLTLPPNNPPRTFIKGLEFNPHGDGGRGSIWLVEAILTGIYEISLTGHVINFFCHPDDPDGCPGTRTAAQAHDLELIHDGNELVAIDLIGGTRRRDKIIRLSPDGIPSGESYSLEPLGGTPAGFTRVSYFHPESNRSIDSIAIIVESSAEIQIAEIREPSIRPILDFVCTDGRGKVSLIWRNTDNYDAIDLFREGKLIASLPGDAEYHVDEDPVEGLVEYELVAMSGDCNLRSGCNLTLGAGKVLNSLYLPDVVLESSQLVDMTEDEIGALWVTQSNPGKIYVFDKRLQLLDTIDSPFRDIEDSEITGIAARHETETLFVYETTTHQIAEIRPSGELASPNFFPSGMPAGDPDDPVIVTAMLFNPEGDEGEGSFWFLDANAAILYERGRSGDLLRQCKHPDQLRDPAPDGTGLTVYNWGLSEVPGENFQTLELSGGGIHDGGSTRIFRLDPLSCQRSIHEIPVHEIRNITWGNFLGHRRSTHDGRPVMYVLSSSRGGSWLFELSAEMPNLPHPVDVEARQPRETRDVEIRFLATEDAKTIEIRRNGELLVELGPEGEPSLYTDRGLEDGFYVYDVRARIGDLRSDNRQATLQVGLGSIIDRALTYPYHLAIQVATLHGERPGESSEYVISSGRSSNGHIIAIFDQHLDRVREFDAPFSKSWNVAALTTRVVNGENEIWVLGWKPGSSRSPRKFPIKILDRNGNPRRELSIEPPRPNGGFLVSPGGLAWDSERDTLWLLERNSATIAEYDMNGGMIRSFPHPLDAHQDSAQNYGIAFRPETGTLYVSSAGPLDRQVSKIVELTREGDLTGIEIPIGSSIYSKSRGFALNIEGTGFVVASLIRGLSELVNYRAFDSVPWVGDVACTPRDGLMLISWRNRASYDSLEIYRNRELIATLDGFLETWTDENPHDCGSFYRVIGRKDSLISPGVICQPPVTRPFVRGDVEEGNGINISDAIAILSYLFLGETKPTCLDAADVDDDGRVNISDSIVLLNYLFLGKGKSPAAPFPFAGCDPTTDTISCD